MKKTFLVDVRSKGEFAALQVPGSVNIPLDELKKELARFEGYDRIIVFCRSGIRSAQAKNMLETHGFENVHNAGSYKKIK